MSVFLRSEGEAVWSFRRLDGLDASAEIPILGPLRLADLYAGTEPGAPTTASSSR